MVSLVLVTNLVVNHGHYDYAVTFKAMIRFFVFFYHFFGEDESTMNIFPLNFQIRLALINH